MQTAEEMLHEQVWTRFMHKPYYHLVDYADEEGNTAIPTGDECRKGIPTVVGWTTPIADGAFFTGLYLYGLCVRDDKLRMSGNDSGAKAREEEMLTLMNALFLLDDVSPVDGFIARGVATDGKSHYSYSSDDQLGPWVLSLWKLYHKDFVDTRTKEEIRSRLLRAIEGIKKTGYNIPTETEGVTRGSYAHGDWRGVCSLLFCIAVEEALTHDSAVREKYRRLCDEHPDGNLFNRLEIASHGFAPDMIRSTVLIQFWINISSHLYLRELEDLHPEQKEYFTAGRKANAVCASYFLKDTGKYKAKYVAPMNVNWRDVLPDFKPSSSNAEALTEASRISGVWEAKYCPGKFAEHKIIGHMMFAMWICATGGDEKIKEYARTCLSDAIEKIDWKTFRHAYAFVAEATLSEY